MKSYRFPLRVKLSLLASVAMFVMLPGIAGAETLSDAVQAAMLNHPSVEAAQANKKALAAEEHEKWSEYLPHLNANGAGGRQFADNSTSRGLSVTRGEGYSWLWEGSLTMTQLLFDGFEVSNRYDAAQARYESAVYNIADVRERLALRAVTAYLDVLRSEDALERLKEHGKLIDDYIGRVRNMVDQGAADETMAVQARDIKAQLAATVANVEAQLRSSIAGYAEVVGHVPESDMEKPTASMDLIPELPEDAMAYAHENHPLLKSASYSGKALAEEAEAEQSALFPDFTGELSYYKRDQKDLIGGEVRDAKAVVRMNWDYSVGGAQLARKKKALYRAQENRAEMRDKMRQIDKEIEIAYSNRMKALSQIKVFTERVDLNKTLLETNRAQFEAARANILQLLQTENALFNARLALMNGEYALLSSQYAILASMGKLQDALGLAVVSTHDD